MSMDLFNKVTFNGKSAHLSSKFRCLMGNFGEIVHKVTHPEKKEESSMPLSSKMRLVAMFTPVSSTEVGIMIILIS